MTDSLEPRAKGRHFILGTRRNHFTSLSKKDKMAAARRGAWGGGQSAGSLTGGRQLDPRHRQGARGAHTGGRRREGRAFGRNAASAENLMPAGVGRQPETQPIRGTPTSGRCDASDTGGRALPPPSLQRSHLPPMPSASGRRGHGKPNAHAPAKRGPKVVRSPRRSLHPNAPPGAASEGGTGRSCPWGHLHCGSRHCACAPRSASAPAPRPLCGTGTAGLQTPTPPSPAEMPPKWQPMEEPRKTRDPDEEGAATGAWGLPEAASSSHWALAPALSLPALTPLP